MIRQDNGSVALTQANQHEQRSQIRRKEDFRKNWYQIETVK